MLSAQDMYLAENKPYKQDPLSLAIETAAKLSAVYAVNKAIGSRFAEIPGMSVKDLRYLGAQTVGGMPWYTAVGKTANSPINIRELVLNSIKATEEMLFKIPRAFSFYSIYSRGYFAESFKSSSFLPPSSAWKPQALHLSRETLLPQFERLYKISEGKISRRMLDGGLAYIDNSLYLSSDVAGGVIRKGAEPVLKHARLMTGDWDKRPIGAAGKGSHEYLNKFAQSHFKMYGMKPAFTDVVIEGGQKILSPMIEFARANLHTAVENYMKLLDDPFETITRFAESATGKSPRFAKIGSKVWETVGLKNIFGVGGYKNLQELGSTKEILAKHLTRGLPLMALGALAFSWTDELLHSTPVLKETVLGGGLKGIPAKMYQDLTLAHARVSDITGMTAYTKAQKEKAPGSTSLAGVVALPATFAIAGGTLGRIQSEIQKVPIGEKGPMPNKMKAFLTDIEAGDTAAARMSKKFNLSKMGKSGAYAAIGAGLGLLATSIFLPGVLGAEKSSEELADIYSGEELVPVRRGRWWSFGITDFEGGDIKGYEPHKTVQMITDAGKRGRLGSYYGLPFLRAAMRVFDPYFLEKEMDEERPYVYWGPSDHGFGFFERLAQPIKEAFKPTIVAHPEALGVIHPSQLKRRQMPTPEGMVDTSDGISTRNYTPETSSPATLTSWSRDALQSGKDLLGFIGFTYGAGIDKATGGQGMLNIDAQYESSGRITSKQRAYWDQELGDIGGITEAIRRMIPAREYGTEYVHGAIKNTQPSWMPETFQYGDPYAAVPLGELRVPGRGYEEIHPELKGVDYEEYPLPYRLSVLQDVARMTPEYYKTKYETEKAILEGRINDQGQRMYEAVMARDQMRKDEEAYGRFDYGDKGTLSAYWLGLKKLGRSIPTEHLYPISPSHKFMGPADPISEYKSYELLDKPFKQWSNPFADYMKPTYNRIMDIATFGNFIPREFKQRAHIEQYFQELQYKKNQVLQQKAQLSAQQGDLENASYYRSGVRPTMFEISPYSEREELYPTMLPNQQKYFSAFIDSNITDRRKILNMVPSQMQTMLKAQWQNQQLADQNNFDAISELQRKEPTIVPQYASDMPRQDFVGYAPGVDLNAVKTKVMTNLGRNIRDHNLWKEDERNARILDMAIQGDQITRPNEDYMMSSRDTKKKIVERYFNSLHMAPQIHATPIAGKTTVDLDTRYDNKQFIHNYMKQQGFVVY